MVYVDDLIPCIPNRMWRWTKSCHLIADSLDELHAFAAGLGMRRGWFQGRGRMPHYDLTSTLRQAAVAAGAIELDRRAFVAKKREISRR